MFQLLIKIVAIGTKNFVLKSILYGRNHTPNSTSCIQHAHEVLIWHKGYYCFQVISTKNVKCKNTRIMIILMLNASIVIRPQNSN